MGLNIQLTELHTDASRGRILVILDTASVEAGHPFSMTLLTLEAWEGDLYLGGLQAKAGMSWMYVDLLGVAPKAQGRGVGRKLLQRVEDVAMSRNLVGVWLDTFSFQAPDFYRKCGYQEFGHLSDAGRDLKRQFFAKRLSQAAGCS